MSKQLYFIQESFTDQELEILNKYFTNTDKPVFGLINLPDVVKGALFARYSRSNKSLRRLFLDEFYTHSTKLTTDSMPVAGMERASSLYDKMILDFGDDSVAQLGGAHIACEQVSNILTKIIEKGRIASYLEQSTRYVYYNKKINGQYHYVIPPEIAGSPLESLYKEYRQTGLGKRLSGQKHVTSSEVYYPRPQGLTLGCTRMDKPLNTCWLKCTQAIMPRSYNMPI